MLVSTWRIIKSSGWSLSSNLIKNNLSNLISQQYKSLEAFNEFTESIQFENRGSFNKAALLMERVYEVACHTTGANSLLTTASAIRLSEQYRMIGKYKEAEKVFDIAGLSGLPKAYALQAISASRLLAGNGKGGLEAAEESCQLAESQDSSDTDVTVFFGSYSMKGVCLLCEGRQEEAEDALQLAARWSSCNGAVAEIQAMSNLGAATWLGYSEGLAGEEAEAETGGGLAQGGEAFLEDIIKRAAEQTTADSQESRDDDELLSEDARRALQKAVGFWEEGIEGAAVGEQLANGSGMCGPDVRVQAVPSHSHNDAATTSRPASACEGGGGGGGSGSGESLVQERTSKSAEFAASYATLLCSASLAYRLAGDDAKSASLLSRAMKALETHSSDASAGSPNPLVEPVTGRCLGMVARTHMLAGNIVTAEGLFRSALEKLKAPYAAEDIRHKYERSQLLMAYSSLLRKWDKREAEGERLSEEARRLLRSLPMFCNHILLSPMIQLPFRWL